LTSSQKKGRGKEEEKKKKRKEEKKERDKKEGREKKDKEATFAQKLDRQNTFLVIMYEL
jgi:hypothetical protein